MTGAIVCNKSKKNMVNDSQSTNPSRFLEVNMGDLLQKTSIFLRYLPWLANVKRFYVARFRIKKVGAVASHPHFVVTNGNLVSKFQP